MSGAQRNVVVVVLRVCWREKEKSKQMCTTIHSDGSGDDEGNVGLLRLFIVAGAAAAAAAAASASDADWSLLRVVQLLLLHLQSTVVVDNHAHLNRNRIGIRAIEVVAATNVGVIGRGKLVDVDHLMALAALIGDVPD